MKTLTIPILAVILGAGTTAAAQQERPTVHAESNTVYVGADGKFESAPDTAVMHFNIAAQESNSQDAYSKAATAAEAVRQALKANGIDAKAAQLSSYSLQPMYDYRNPKQKVVGYRVMAAVTVKLKDFAKIGPLVDSLAAIEETNNQSLNYTLENIDVAKQKAIEDAFQRAKASAATIARASERTLGALSYASVDTFEQVIPMMRYEGMANKMSAQMAPAAPPTQDFTPQTVTVTAHVNAVFALK